MRPHCGALTGALGAATVPQRAGPRAKGAAMAANARRSSGRRDVYREITERILEALEAGTVPWRRPWRDFGMQRNYSSGRPYGGINQLLTQLSQQAQAYGSPFWLT